jgi:hypothetical protein
MLQEKSDLRPWMPSQEGTATSWFRKLPTQLLSRQTGTAQARDREGIAQERDVFEKRREILIGAKVEVAVEVI